VRTYYLKVNLTLSIDDEIIQQARRRADALGKSVNQLVREYLEQLAGKSDLKVLADEFEELSRNPLGNSRGWKFNREEIHERR
jgi:uncharacterized protein DUF6364